MTITDWTGATGVTLLLVAFFLNLVGRLPREGATYLLLNVVGAGLACLASVMLRYWPFIILEGCWTLVSAIGLVARLKYKP
ncbi:MAG TPA: hypothetical protein VNW04_02430 [Puia sp.]|jgi:hypothetical protein|nr:hypothetical protein [Puia sp.]